MSSGDINSNTNTGFKAGTMIKSNKLAFDYILANAEDGTEQSTHALEDINICIKQGEFIAVLGHNGSGKSTLAKHLNALLVPTSGTLWVNGFDTANEAFVWDIRNSTGMVFQNPDNQIVAYIVEEDIAFGPENLGVPPDEIRERVDSALKAVGMLDYASHSAHRLSGGQKQRISIAGVLAMRPECIVFDEPTAMLDPLGRKEVMNTIKKLNAEGITVILITHYMDEAVMAGRVIVMSDGRIVMTGTPGQIFVQTERLAELGLDVPQVTQVAAKLISRGINIRRDILTVDEMVDELKCLLKSKM